MEQIHIDWGGPMSLVDASEQNGSSYTLTRHAGTRPASRTTVTLETSRFRTGAIVNDFSRKWLLRGGVQWIAESCRTFICMNSSPNKALQPTANPLRGLSAAELGR